MVSCQDKPNVGSDSVTVHIRIMGCPPGTRVFMLISGRIRFLYSLVEK